MLETITAEELVNTPLSSPRWVVEDLVGVGVTLLVGSPKVGKSWLVLRLAECVSRGDSLWGFATCGGAVLDLALEDNLPRIQQRLFRLADECSETFHLCVNAPSLADGLLDEIAAFVATHPGTRLVIVDTLQTVRQSPQKSAYASDYRDVRDFKALADHFGLAVVLVHLCPQALEVREGLPLHQVLLAQAVPGGHQLYHVEPPVGQLVGGVHERQVDVPPTGAARIARRRGSAGRQPHCEQGGKQ